MSTDIATILPEAVPGHWATAEGRDMAAEYLRMPREALMMAELTDLELANAVFMADRHSLDLIAFQTAAKQRIRWLSAHLAAAEKQA